MKKDIISSLIIIILGFIVLRQCSGTGTGSDVAPKIDSIYLPGTIDTVLFEVEKVVYKYLKPDTFKQVIDLTTGDTSMLYETNIDDSLITAKIVSNVKGTLLSTNFNYTPKFPKFITRVDTLKITIPYEVPKERWGVYAGAIIGGNATVFNLQPTVLVKTDKNLQVSAGYDLIHKTYNVGVYTKLVWPQIFTLNRN
jgi:hypothetical protein